MILFLLLFFGERDVCYVCCDAMSLLLQRDDAGRMRGDELYGEKNEDEDLSV